MLTPTTPENQANFPASQAAGMVHEPQEDKVAIVGKRLTLAAFHQLSGTLAGYPFVKIVVTRSKGCIHFIDTDSYGFHADYIAERILGKNRAEIRAKIDSFNHSIYLEPDREFLVGLITLHEKNDKQFFSLETVEIDNMGPDMLTEFYNITKTYLDPSLPLYFKPANHEQEAIVTKISTNDLPRIYNHELFSTKKYVALNPGEAVGRIRVIEADEFKKQRSSIEWYDIVVMERVPDNIPRVAGIINAEHTTPLSHTNVLASGWQIPNAIQVGIIDEIHQKKLVNKWVKYHVSSSASHVELLEIDKPAGDLNKPAWRIHRINLEEPETANTDIRSLEDLRMTDRFRFGTKAANLGELIHLLKHGSDRMTGFYRVARPPRANLLSYLCTHLNTTEAKLSEAAHEYLCNNIKIPQGIAIPFALQREFLELSPRIQQAIGKLKMALQLESQEAAATCVQLQQLIRATRISDALRDRIDSKIARYLAGVSSFVIRSSSNAEDLESFSAAGIYESINHVTTADRIFSSIKEVWASLTSPRSVQLCHEVGISLDDSYMGAIIQEEIDADMGGVLVTTNPLNPNGDFRNVFINVSDKSPVEVVEGKVPPFQYLYNTVEGGGRTLSLGHSKVDLSESKKHVLQRLAIVGRLLQSHFSQNYTFDRPVDIEWAAKGDVIYILQLRPYAS